MFEINELLLLLFLLPILQIKWSNCRKCKCNVSQSYNKMITDTFYPIFTLTITVLACFIQKKQKQKKKLRASPPPRYLFGPLKGLTATPDPQLQLFLALPKTSASIFFLYYSLWTWYYVSCLAFVCLFVCLSFSGEVCLLSIRGEFKTQGVIQKMNY